MSKYTLAHRTIVGLAATLSLAMLGACSGPLPSGKPATRFEKTPAPQAPDYGSPAAWLAWPGRNGLERSTAPGDRAINEAAAPADVFYIHPTTYLKNDHWNAPYDAVTAFGAPVLMNQASTFNGCCRIYAPHYRQATFAGFADDRAMDLAYGDVRRAFVYYLQHENHGRPYILASHSQGTAHLVRLLQDEVIGKPAQSNLIAVYAIGAYVPQSFAGLGLPVCSSGAQTGCLISWNTNQRHHPNMVRLTSNPRYWWGNEYISSRRTPAVCVNPLSWRTDGFVPRSANLGAVSIPKTIPSESASAVELPRPVPALTDAQCVDHVVLADVPLTATRFHDPLSLLFGTYHLFDYALFYENIRANAQLRVDTWMKTPSHDLATASAGAP